MRLTVPFFVIGSLLATLAPNISVIAAGRLISGVGAGASIVVGPIFVSEISPPQSKGVLGASTQVMINVGILMTQVLGYFLNYGNTVWRIVLAIGGALGAMQFFGLVGAIESPEWLGSNGKPALARKNLIKIRGKDLTEDEATKWKTAGEDEDENEGLLSSQVSINESTNRKDSKPSVGIFEVIYHPDHYKAIIAVVAVMLAQQLCGINSVIMYSVSFLSEILPTAAGLITVAVGGLNLVVTVACAPLADRFGRKTCLLLSIAGMGTNAVLLAIGIVYDIQILTGIVTLLFVASFAVGLGPVPFILASELVGPEAVGATQSWALAVNWLAMFIVAQFFPMLNRAMGKGKVFFLFAGLAAGFFVFISYWVPETRGKKDADDVWGRERRED